MSEIHFADYLKQFVYSKLLASNTRTVPSLCPMTIALPSGDIPTALAFTESLKSPVV